MMSPVVTRFAPSPTGYLHLGHAHSVLFGWRAARAAGGRFLLRIEDIDGARCTPEFEAAILEDLAWLGLDWAAPPRRQSEHMADYAAALARLDAEGLLYPCFGTRKGIRAENERGGNMACRRRRVTRHRLEGRHRPDGVVSNRAQMPVRWGTTRIDRPSGASTRHTSRSSAAVCSVVSTP